MARDGGPPRPQSVRLREGLKLLLRRCGIRVVALPDSTPGELRFVQDWEW